MLITLSTRSVLTGSDCVLFWLRTLTDWFANKISANIFIPKLNNIIQRYFYNDAIQRCYFQISNALFFLQIIILHVGMSLVLWSCPCQGCCSTVTCEELLKVLFVLFIDLLIIFENLSYKRAVNKHRNKNKIIWFVCINSILRR